MEASAVTQLFTRLQAQRLRAWAAGGWAVDILLGRQTRDHHDLDVAVDADDLEALRQLLELDGFEPTADWLPARLELSSADGRIIDVHPVVFASDGSGTQSGLDGETFHYAADGFTVGSLLGVAIPCLSARQQLAFRVGYRRRPVDEHDIPLLESLCTRRSESP